MKLDFWQITPVATFAIFIAPVFIVLFSLAGDYSDNWTHLYNHVLFGYIENSIYLVLGVSIMVIIIGVGTAWLVTNYNFTGKNILGFGELYGKRIVSFFKDEPIVGGYLNGFYLIIIGFLLNELKDNKNYLTILFSIIFIISILLTGERSNTIRAILGISIFFLAL